LFAGLTVWEHLAFTAASYGVENFRDYAQSLLMQFGLEEKRNELAENLSRGMRQKVSVACAFLHDPSVLLFDEPLTGLDPTGIRVLTDSIRRRAEAGAAIVVSSHLLTLVEDLCTDLLLLNRGRRVAFGRLSSVLDQFTDRDRDPRLEDVYFAMTRENAA
jgi:ABC-2 type transport system ATP-binding protein